MFRIGHKALDLQLINARIGFLTATRTWTSDFLNKLQLENKISNVWSKKPKKKESIKSNNLTRYSEPQDDMKVVRRTHNCDMILMNLTKLKDTTQLIEKLIYFENLQASPSRKVLLILASIFAKNGDIKSIRHVQKICLETYPKEYEWIMGYKHYEAEAKWKSGKIENSVELFQHLFNTHIAQRKKITEMVAFLMRYVFTKRLREHYQLLERFSGACLDEDFFLPAVHLWSISFTSNDHQAWSVCDKLFVIYPELKNRVAVKFGFVIKNAQERDSVELLQRLLEFILKYDLNEYLKVCLGHLLIMQCENETVTTALETFDYAYKMKIGLPPNSVNRLFILLVQHKHEIPLSLLHLKYLKTHSIPKVNVKW